MEKYKEYVRLLSRNNDSKEFFNSDGKHAIIVFGELFNIAKDYVYIFAGCLTSPVANSPEYIQSLSGFIERGGIVRILLNKFDSKNIIYSDVIRRLLYYKIIGKNVDIRTTLLKPHYSEDPDKKELHFTVVDDKAYRIETNVDERSATCNFNNATTAKDLRKIFDMIYVNSSMSKELDLNKLFNNML